MRTVLIISLSGSTQRTTSKTMKNRGSIGISSIADISRVVVPNIIHETERYPSFPEVSDAEDVSLQNPELDSLEILKAQSTLGRDGS